MRNNSFEINNYYGLLIITLVLLLIGLFMILSASAAWGYQNQRDLYYFFKRQLVGALIGFFLLAFSARLNYRIWQSASVVLLILSIGLLLLVFVPGFGYEVNGAKRWLNLGFISFQPSEFSKLALILFAANVLSRQRARRDLNKYLPILVATILIGGIVCLQRDLGTAIIIGTIFLVLLFVGGLEIRYCVSLLVIMAVIATIFAVGVEYRRDRLATFFNPNNDPEGAGYQIRQSLIAFGSGGIFGKGLGKSRQKFFYLPAAYTDFIFAVLGEEMGLIGTSLVTLFYFFFGYFGLRTAIGANDFFGRITAAGICIWVAVQAFINMAAVTHTIPVTGVPLPLISYGGSSLIFTLWGIGILLSIAKGERGVNVASAYSWRWDRRTRLSRSLRAE